MSLVQIESEHVSDFSEPADERGTGPGGLCGLGGGEGEVVSSETGFGCLRVIGMTKCPR